MTERNERQEKLFAKLNGRRGRYVVVFTDSEDMRRDAMRAYAAPHIANPVAFHPGRTLHEDEWYHINLNEAQITAMIAPYTDNARTAGDLNTISADDYEKVVALYKTDGNRLLVTKISAGMRIESKTFIGLNDHPEITSYRKAIEFTGIVDAYYDGTDMLYFRNYSKIRALFPGIEDFYRDATAGEEQAFLRHAFFEIHDIDVAAISMRDSQKIAEILDDERIMLDDRKFQKRIIDYAHAYTPELVSGSNKLKITDKDALRKTLNLLTDRYYTSELFGDKREAIDSAKLED